MKPTHQFLLLFFLFTFSVSFSQTVVRTQIPDTTHYWKNKNIVGFDFNQIAFINWSAGGVNAVSGLVKGNFTRDYKKALTKWSNELIVRYGLNKQDGIGVRKTDDVFQLNSTFSHQNDSISNWSHSAKFNFNTQFTNGYAYPNTELAISKPFAPAYTYLGIGAEYNNKEKNLNLYFSPLTFKNTLVLDQRLADEGAFGVKSAVLDSNGNIIQHGRKSKTGIGILVTGNYKNQIMKNINMENRLSLYTDYIHQFGNIVVNWQAMVDMTVNEYIKVNLGLNLFYDDNIKTKEQVNGQQVIMGPRVQLKQLLGFGATYNF